jgi:DNA-binding transcriptional LysR family regulator
MHFDLIDLKLFLNTLNSGSITAGAERSHLSLASASARLRGLESSLGAPVLLRGRRGIAPTPAGQALAHHARAVLLQVERMQDDLGDYVHGFKGRVRLLCNTTSITEHLPEPLAAFLQDHPNVDIDIGEFASHRIVPEIRQGTADIGIVSDGVDLSGLEVLPFRRDILALIAPPGHALAEHKRVRFAQALEYDFVGLAADSGLAVHLEDKAALTGRRIHARVRVRAFETIIRMVAAGAGLGVVPATALGRPGRARVARIELEDEWARRQLRLCMRTLDGLPAYAQALAHALTAAS